MPQLVWTFQSPYKLLLLLGIDLQFLGYPVGSLVTISTKPSWLHFSNGV